MAVLLASQPTASTCSPTWPPRRNTFSGPSPGTRTPGRQLNSLGRGDGQVTDAVAGRVVDRVGDGGGAHDADLAHALGTHRVQVRVVLLHPHGLGVLDVGAGGDVVLREVVVEEVLVPLVDDRLLHRRHADARGHGADELRTGERLVDDATGRAHAEQPQHPCHSKTSAPRTSRRRRVAFQRDDDKLCKNLSLMSVLAQVVAITEKRRS